MSFDPGPNLESHRPRLHPLLAYPLMFGSLVFGIALLLTVATGPFNLVLLLLSLALLTLAGLVYTST